MALFAKAVNPKKLKQDVFRLEFLTAIHEMEREIRSEFEKTVESWDKKPKFQSEITLKGGPAALVGTDDEVYGYVNNGTPPHVIAAKSGKSLAFQWRGPGSYRPKTRPRIIGSSAGGPTGDTVYPKAVQHPGTEAREFDKTIQIKMTPRFKKRMEEAMRDAAKKSGHGV